MSTPTSIMVVSTAKTTVPAVVPATMVTAEHTTPVVGFSSMTATEQSTMGFMPVAVVTVAPAKKSTLTVSSVASVTVKDAALMAAVGLSVTGRAFYASVASVAVSSEKASPSAVCITFYAFVVPVPVKASTIAVALMVGFHLGRFNASLAVRSADYAFMVSFLRGIKSALMPCRSTASVWPADDAAVTTMVFHV